MAEFKLAYEKTLSHEGYLSNDRHDRGGLTWKGIAENIWPDWHGWKIIRAQMARGLSKRTLTEALLIDPKLKALEREFYKAHFWDKANLDFVTSQELAEEIFDTGVNQGMGTAVEYLQEALNFLNRNGEDYPDIAVDGGLGPKTLRTLLAFLRNRTGGRTEEGNTRVLLKALNGLQFERYGEICRRDQTQERFFYGWINTRVA